MDILGVDGVLYKGRMSSQLGARTGEKELAGEEHRCFLDLALLENKGRQVD